MSVIEYIRSQRHRAHRGGLDPTGGGGGGGPDLDPADRIAYADTFGTSTNRSLIGLTADVVEPPDEWIRIRAVGLINSFDGSTYTATNDAWKPASGGTYRVQAVVSSTSGSGSWTLTCTTGTATTPSGSSFITDYSPVGGDPVASGAAGSGATAVFDRTISAGEHIALWFELTSDAEFGYSVQFNIFPAT